MWRCELRSTGEILVCLTVKFSLYLITEDIIAHWEDQDVGGWIILKWILER
jgi:hypothetical protein